MVRRLQSNFLWLLIFIVGIGISLPVQGLEILLPGGQAATTPVKPQQELVKLLSTGLIWANGDILEGEPVTADDKTLIWKSDLFTDPLEIEMLALQEIRFHLPSQIHEDPMRILLRTGDILYGKLAGISDSELQFESTRHGKFSVARDRIQTVRRINQTGLIYFGPAGMDGWDHLGTSDRWKELPDGRLQTTSDGAAITREVDFEDQNLIEIVLTSTQRPAFQLLFTKDSKPLSIETWDEYLVITHENEFREVMEVPKEQKKLHLQLMLDRQATKLMIFGNSGEILGELSAKQALPSRIGIKNMGSDLTLEHLQVSRWSGAVPKPLKEKEGRIHLADGTVEYGALGEFSADDNTVAVGEKQVPLEDIAALFLGQEKPREQPKQEADSDNAKPEQAMVSWSDGGLLMGELVSLDEKSIQIKTDFSQEPVSSDMDGVRLIRFPKVERKTQDLPDRLFVNSRELRGQLIVNEEGSEPIRWQPIGGRNASGINAKGNFRILRAEQKETGIDSKKYPDIIYLANGDVFPCQVTETNDETIQLTTPLSQVTELPVELVKAIEFTANSAPERFGFGKGWKKVSGSPLQTDEKLRFTGFGSIGHPDLLTGDEIRFKLNWNANEYTQFNISLFTDSKFSTTNATGTSIVCNGNSVWTQKLQNQNGQVFFGGGQVDQEKVLRLDDYHVDVKLRIRDGYLQIWLNEKLLETEKLKRDSARHRGLLFTCNVSRIHRGGGFQPFANQTSGLTIDDFQIRNISGSAIRQFILDESRERTLTVPRFRRDDPPTHVIISPTGDLLRGRLLGVNESEVEFESRLETFRFPRERINSIIWLRPDQALAKAKAEDNETEEETKPAELVNTELPAVEQDQAFVQIRLENGSVISMSADSVDGEKLVGTTPQLGECKVPAAAIREIYIGDVPEQQELKLFADWVPKRAPEPDWDAAAAGGEGDTPGAELIGTTAPPFEIPGLNGEPFSLTDHKDQVVVLDFWATWCGPCVMALPEYIKVTNEFDQKKVLFVAVNLQESPQQVRKFLEQKKLETTVAMDSSGDVSNQFKVSGIPHTVVLGPGNVIEDVHVGYAPGNAEKIGNTIQQLLDGTWKRPEKSE